eukprot:TRINITY_DN868_c0_g1_i1.p1 TRINITY_DN868_c0_g1~~TRINITY_DN868_c0_g1_i1.p1  ORF type:complete len:372 (+),score=11.11 TRINITY_DN868_c0_g1_i1:122-1237(+)
MPQALVVAGAVLSILLRSAHAQGQYVLCLAEVEFETPCGKSPCKVPPVYVRDVATWLGTDLLFTPAHKRSPFDVMEIGGAADGASTADCVRNSQLCPKEQLCAADLSVQGYAQELTACAAHPTLCWETLRHRVRVVDVAIGPVDVALQPQPTPPDDTGLSATELALVIGGSAVCIAGVCLAVVLWRVYSSEPRAAHWQGSRGPALHPLAPPATATPASDRGGTSDSTAALHDGMLEANCIPPSPSSQITPRELRYADQHKRRGIGDLIIAVPTAVRDRFALSPPCTPSSRPASAVPPPCRTSLPATPAAATQVHPTSEQPRAPVDRLVRSGWIRRTGEARSRPLVDVGSVPDVAPGGFEICDSPQLPYPRQ